MLGEHARAPPRWDRDEWGKWCDDVTTGLCMMAEGWELDDQIRTREPTLGRILMFLLPVTMVAGALLSYLTGVIPRGVAVLVVIVGAVVGVADLLYLRWFEGFVDRMARRSVRRFRLPIDDLGQRLEAGLFKRSVPYEGSKRDYRVAHGGAMVDVHLRAEGGWTYVYVGPPEEGRDLDGLLELIGEVLG